MKEIFRQIQAFLGASPRPLLVILGPTASGKTGCSIELAHMLGQSRRGMELWGRDISAPQLSKVEIINGDSRQLYRFLSIGTAKISQEEMQGIPHHLIDVLDPKEEATAAWYKQEAVRTIGEIQKRGNVPLLVGGSMLYVSAVIDNLEFVAEADPQLREKLSREYDRDQGAALMRTLEERDPETALSLDPRNKVYLIRALEICLLAQGKASLAKKKSACPFDLFILGVTLPREELHQRINARVRQMFERGWVEEVRELLAQGYTTDDPGLESHGYREIAAAVRSGKWKAPRLCSGQVESGKFSTEQEQSLIAEISAKSRQYAKRQMTWWRGDSRIRWMADNAS